MLNLRNVGFLGALTEPKPDIYQVGIRTTSTSTSITLPSNLQQGDIVIVASVSDNASQTSPSGWTSIYSSTLNSTQSKAMYKIMGSTPDTSLSGLASSSAHIAVAFRNVNATTPIDNTVAIGGSSTNSRVVIPTNTTITPNTRMIAIGFVDDDSADRFNEPQGDGGGWEAGGFAANTATVMLVSKIIREPRTVTPGEFIYYIADVENTDFWNAISFSLRQK